jgi:CheY-like chemotaxis protein
LAVVEQILWLSSAKGERQRQRAVATAPLAPDARGAGRLVLIAEDYADTRALYAEHITEAGFRVVEACDGAEAVALATSLKPDAIVMDLSMPRLDGWDATRQIRAVSGMEDTYIVVLSALNSDISRGMAFDAGCNDFIAKPFLPAALVAVLTVHFRAKDESTDDD